MQETIQRAQKHANKDLQCIPLRFYEMVMINGPALKALIEEEFGDGIMSAIDFDLELDRLANPNGDRVRLLMSGKFLPYKYYGAEQGLPEYGVKEE
jgi:cyanate lyase